MSETLEVADVINDITTIRSSLAKKSDEELVKVINMIPESGKLHFGIDSAVFNFFATGKLTEKDRKFIELCHVLLFSQYGLEE